MRERKQPSWEDLFGYVYLLRCGDHYKIGFSKKPRKRLKQFRTGSPHPVELIHTLRTIHYKHVERKLHYKFAAKRVRGEWFKLDAEDVEYIMIINGIGRTPEEEAEIEKRNAEYHAEQRAKEESAYMAQMNQLLTSLVGL